MFPRLHLILAMSQKKIRCFLRKTVSAQSSQLTNVLESFSLLTAEKCRKKQSRLYMHKKSRKKFHIASSAAVILRLLFRKFLHDLGKETNMYLAISKRSKFNAIDLIETNQIQKIFTNVTEIFWRKNVSIHAEKMKRFLFEKRNNLFDFSPEITIAPDLGSRRANLKDNDFLRNILKRRSIIKKIKYLNLKRKLI